MAWARGRRLKAHDILSEPFVRQLHNRMFGDVWKWAGHYRTTNKNIGVDRAYIIEEIARLIADARYWVDENSFAADETAVRLHHKLAWIHPFPNGNGRHARLAADLLIGTLGGTQFTWGEELADDSEAARLEYIATLREADAGDIAPLVAFARR